MPPRRPPFVYHPPSPEWMRREVQRLSVQLSWPQALYAAYKGDTGKLGKYLREYPELVDEFKLAQLAALLACRVQRGSRGKRKGVVLTARVEAQRRLLALTRSYLREMRRGRSRVAPGSREQALNQAVDHLVEDGCEFEQSDLKQVAETLRRKGVPARRR